MGSIFFIIIVSSHVAFIQKRRKMIFLWMSYDKTIAQWMKNCMTNGKLKTKLHNGWKLWNKGCKMDEKLRFLKKNELLLQRRLHILDEKSHNDHNVENLKM
jgi:hypothetical protein